MNKIIPAFVVLFLSWCVYNLYFNPNNGIITVSEYPHAVALCQGDVPDAPLHTVEGEAHIWQEGGILYTVNYGHMGDIEVKLLQVLAIRDCAKLNNK